MTSTPPSDGASNGMGGFAYGIGLSVGIVLLITTITLISHYCTRNNNTTTTSQLPSPQTEHVEEIVGLNEATLTSYPKLLYSEVKKNHKDPTTITCCSICLADYKSSDMLRVLPDCGHLFHVKCVDQWLRLHRTCPMCRTSPMIILMSAPLAEVVPLATRPIE